MRLARDADFGLNTDNMLNNLECQNFLISKRQPVSN